MDEIDLPDYIGEVVSVGGLCYQFVGMVPGTPDTATVQGVFTTCGECAIGSAAATVPDSSAVDTVSSAAVDTASSTQSTASSGQTASSYAASLAQPTTDCIGCDYLGETSLTATVDFANDCATCATFTGYTLTMFQLLDTAYWQGGPDGPDGLEIQLFCDGLEWRVEVSMSTGTCGTLGTETVALFCSSPYPTGTVVIPIHYDIFGTPTFCGNMTITFS